MFSLFKSKNDEVEQIYNAIIDQSRQSVLYTGYGVPDTPQGRFQMIALHAIPSMLIDRIFKDIELSFREIGVGDLSVPKKMKRYMKDFNGMIQAHSAANADHADIVRRNVFGEDGKMPTKFKKYIEGLFT